MDRLWAPWRMQYIQESDNGGECIFCVKPKQESDRENLILHRGAHCFVMMNRYPYNNGHLMVVPYRHTAELDDLADEAALELWRSICLCKRALTTAFHPEGFNVGINCGRVAGAGIDRHFHVHIVPRWSGDTNFMPVVGETKVISQGIADTYDALLPCFQAAGAMR